MSKIEIGLLGTLLAIISTIAGGWLFVDQRFAHAELVAMQFTQQQVETRGVILSQEIRSLNAELNWLQQKEASGNADAFDQKYRLYLEQELERLYDDQQELHRLRQ